MRSHELLPPAGPADGRLLVVAGGPDAPEVDLRAEGWSVVAEAEVPPDTRPVLVVTVGPRGSIADALDTIERVPLSACLLLSTEVVNDVTVERAAIRLAGHLGATIERIEDLDDPPVTGGVLLVVDDEAADDPRVTIRQARERFAELSTSAASVGSGRSLDALRRRLQASERARSHLAARAAGLELDLRSATRELALEQRRRDQLERSTSYRLGSAIVQGLRDPRQMPRRSRELVDRWRRRDQGRTTAVPRTGGSDTGPPDAAPRAPIVTTVPAVAAPARRNAIAAIVTDGVAEALVDDVLLTRLLPHDAVDLIVATSPKVVLIESEACLTGEAWAGAGSGAVPTRDRDLVAVLDAAERAGAATVLWWSGRRSAAPGLQPIAARCTLEVAADEAGFDWTIGVPVHRVHDAVRRHRLRQAHALREADPGSHPSPSRSPRLALGVWRGPLRPPAALAAVVDDLIGALDPSSWHGTGRWSPWPLADAWVVPADGPDRWQLAAAAVAGALPVVPGGGPLPTWATDLGAVAADTVDPAMFTEGGDRTAFDRRRPGWPAQRTAALHGGIVAALRGLGDLLGIEVVPASSRSVALHLGAAGQGDDLHLDTVLAQRDLPPGSVVVAHDGLSDRAVATCEALGLRVARHEPADTRFALRLEPGHGADHVASLVAGWELTRADVVGLGDVTSLTAGTVADLIRPGGEPGAPPAFLIARSETSSGRDLLPDTPADGAWDTDRTLPVVPYPEVPAVLVPRPEGGR